MSRGMPEGKSKRKSTASERQKPQNRQRRQPAELARRRILDAAAERLRESGPQGLRLSDIAGDLGITHQAILHHFGTREGLLQELADHAMAGLSRDLVEAFRDESAQPLEPRQLLDRAFDSFGQRGNARLIAWLALSGLDRRPSAPPLRHFLREIAEELHGRLIERQPEAEEPISFEQVLFSLLLAGVTAFGDSIAGGAMRRSAGLEHEPEAEEHFRDWLSELLVDQLS